ncbi:MAG: rod shape-determining protein MreD [Flavobacteriales bacterium]|nr:hypothetical protein [Flavobacteriales bacterium]MCC6578360.1 rod shape-determining protein MreD [Flavobacteriales bacterium]NUQ14584.1 rod shape-determining protein MreD [Flavobacteriales bacterium]
MIATIVANLLRFVALIALQVIVLDHLDVANGWLVPHLYVLFLLMLPFELPAWALLLAGAATGALMDLLSATPGMHTTACLVMMYVRSPWQRLIAPREGYEFGMRPDLRHMGLSWTLTYAGVLVLVHHLWLFFFELHRFDRAGGTFLRAVGSAAFTLVLVLLGQLLMRSERRQRA